MTHDPENPWASITPERRELYFRVIDHHTDIQLIGDRLAYLELHFPLDMIDIGLKWLINNNITGKNFMPWWVTVCQRSDLEMHRLLLSVVNNIKQAKVIAGKNFRT